ncbi:DUF5134 domain-containing protein [Streptomyces sp. NPDC050504]|uniref:DUF5134 domain-containing protein n=1 Tax=Streptomyces sp. NPDC050504 TaxID=3365618 RepID=UPI0037A4EB9C
MHGPAMSGWLLVALCAATGAYCLLRMRSGSGADERGSARGEAVMGFGMAAMAVPAAVVAPPEWSWLVYAAVFGAAALRALWLARRDAHHLHHLVGSLAMVYMAVAMAPGAGGGGGAHAGHGGGGGTGAGAAGAGGIPLLTGVLVLYFAGYVLLAGARLVPVASTAGGSGVAWGARPELALACRLSMGLAMLTMLLTL